MTLVMFFTRFVSSQQLRFLRHAHGHYRPFQAIKENFIHCRSITAQMGLLSLIPLLFFCWFGPMFSRCLLKIMWRG